MAKGLRRNIDYQRLVSDALQGQLVEQAKPYLTGDFSEHKFVTSHLIEALSLGLINCFKTVTDGAFKAEKIIFRHVPNTDIAEYERIFQCEVAFSGEEFRIYFAKENT